MGLNSSRAFWTEEATRRQRAVSSCRLEPSPKEPVFLTLSAALLRFNWPQSTIYSLIQSMLPKSRKRGSCTLTHMRRYGLFADLLMQYNCRLIFLIHILLR